MDNNSIDHMCVSCGEVTTYNTSFSPGEIITTCTKCGSVVKYEKVPGPFNI